MPYLLLSLFFLTITNSVGLALLLRRGERAQAPPPRPSGPTAPLEQNIILSNGEGGGEVIMPALIRQAFDEKKVNSIGDILS